MDPQADNAAMRTKRKDRVVSEIGVERQYDVAPALGTLKYTFVRLTAKSDVFNVQYVPLRPLLKHELGNVRRNVFVQQQLQSQA